MPETKSSSHTAPMNRVLSTAAAPGARATCGRVADGGADVERLRDAKEQLLEAVHRLLCIHLGTPPERFVWQWTDKDERLPPRRRDDAAASSRSATSPCRSRTTSASCTTRAPSSPLGRTFTVEYLGNVVGAPPVVYLNVEIDLLKSLAMDTIVGGEPVWFGCDTGKMSNGELGVWDAGALRLRRRLRHRACRCRKADRLLHHDTLMTHAMLFTGVDVLDGAPRALAGREQLGRREGRQGLLDDERQLVRRVRLRDRRTPRRAARRAAGGAGRRSRSCCPPGTRWAPSPAEA